MRKRLEIDIKVGIFVTLGVGLVMFAIIILGGAKTLLSSHRGYRVHFDHAQGIIKGSKVVLNGIKVGTVDTVDFDSERGNIRIQILVEEKYSKWIRTDSYAEIATQGVLGDKYISVSKGTDSSEILKGDSEIKIGTSKGLDTFLDEGQALMTSLNKISQNLEILTNSFVHNNRADRLFEGIAASAKNLADASGKLKGQLDDIDLVKTVETVNSILQKIDTGEGTLGALVNDPALYYYAQSVVGGINRNRVVRNVVRQAIRDNASEKKSEPQK